MTTICYLWSTANVKWKDANWRWSECFTTPDTGSLITPGVDASLLTPQWLEEPWNPYKSDEEKRKRKRLIKLICKIRGIEYNEEKQMKDFKVTIDDIKMVIKAVAEINVNIK